MNPTIIEIISDCLISATSTYITILIPFVGALYIYKRSTRSAAESKIFELGRSISEILETRLVAYPGVAINIQSCIERHIPFEKYTNKDDAITETLIESISAFGFEKEGKNASELAERIITIIHYRYDSLIPVGVNWSGRGPAFGMSGVNKSPKDTFFPFGTLLYREWINNFSIHYNDIWRGFTFSRVKELSKKLHYNIDESEEYYNNCFEGIINWAADLDEKMHAINKLHSQLITQIQIIDFTINEADLLKSLRVNGIYLFLLGASGFMLPAIMSKLSLLNASNLLALVVVSIFLIALIPFNLLNKKDNTISSKRKSLYHNLKNNLKLPREKPAKYYSGFLQIFCQMQEALSIPSSLIKKSKKIIDGMALVGDISAKIHIELEPYFIHLKGKESSKSKTADSKKFDKNLVGTSISTINLIDPSYDFSRIVKDIQISASYLSVSKVEHGSSMNLFKYHLSTPEIKRNMIDGLLSIRNEFKDRADVSNLLSAIENINREAESLKEMLGREIKNEAAH